jgi:hypothetical protein
MLAQVQALGLGLVEAGDGVCKDKTHGWAGAARQWQPGWLAAGHLLSPPSLQQPSSAAAARSLHSSRSLHSLLVGFLIALGCSAAAGVLAQTCARLCSPRPQKTHSSTWHGHTATLLPHTPRPASAIIHTSSSEHLLPPAYLPARGAYCVHRVPDAPV